MSVLPLFHPCRAYLDGTNGLVFLQQDGLERALRDGFFALQIPPDFDLAPGIKLAQEFYREPIEDQAQVDSRYRGFRKHPDIYFDRESFQTEHILADARQRQAAFPADVVHMCEQMHEIAGSILRSILGSIGVSPQLWPEVTGNTSEGGGIQWFALSHYRSERRMLGAPAHKDTGFVTVLYCDQPGLQAKLQDGWVEVEPVKGCFLINFGGSLELLTSRLPSPTAAVLHQVRECSANADKGDRYSFAAFLNPPASGSLYSISADGQRAEPVIPVETFLREFNEQTWKDDYNDFGIPEEKNNHGKCAILQVDGKSLSSTPVSKTPFPGVIAHHPGTHSAADHFEAFHHATICKGLDASAYFAQSGIADLAEKNGGLCSFWLGDDLALYQTTNVPLVEDSDLTPSINSNAGLFGSFLGALPLSDERRQAKRAVVERVLGSNRFVTGLDQHVREMAREYLAKVSSERLSLQDFCLHIVAHIDSGLPGVLDFHQKPLTDYLQSSKYGSIAKDFFEIASDVISKMNPESIKNADMIVDMTRDMLESNYESIVNAPPTNMVLAQFAVFSRPFTLESIRSLDADSLKELGTVIVATYDTTALSLLWTLTYLEDTPTEKERLLHAIDSGENALDVAYLQVLEAIRLGGSNPTALWRRTNRPVSILHREVEVTIPGNTMLWLDRRRANRDARLFPSPERFDSNNICQAMRGEKGHAVSLLARNRYEINSFNMVNTHRSPRKCPGRLFSVRQQALILTELYCLYQVSVTESDATLAPHRAMPRPSRSGTIIITARDTAHKSVSHGESL
ncbi:cytochrome P450 [Pseudomonas sp. KFB-139]|uniref:2-oxoglutarate-dependent ethylene/succinate-forming enzyme n=1 Tax=Pseudomonas serbiensis TaxID=3064350 RepID=A0ABT9CI90_9PSED|nr:cytochrome P450 [Pseudomonas sp. KFB-138]MDO7925197.1 cytochrome P450 [Pseudomonas sp. KFB-138]